MQGTPWYYWQRVSLVHPSIPLLGTEPLPGGHSRCCDAEHSILIQNLQGQSSLSSFPTAMPQCEGGPWRQPREVHFDQTHQQFETGFHIRIYSAEKAWDSPGRHKIVQHWHVLSGSIPRYIPGTVVRLSLWKYVWPCLVNCFTVTSTTIRSSQCGFFHFSWCLKQPALATSTNTLQQAIIFKCQTFYSTQSEQILDVFRMKSDPNGRQIIVIDSGKDVAWSLSFSNWNASKMTPAEIDLWPTLLWIQYATLPSSILVFPPWPRMDRNATLLIWVVLVLGCYAGVSWSGRSFLLDFNVGQSNVA